MGDQAAEALERLIGRLEAAAAGDDAGRPKDAIDDVLDGPRRQSAVSEVRHDPVIEQFRRELSDGLIRADTAGRLLSLITTVVERLL